MIKFWRLRGYGLGVSAYGELGDSFYISTPAGGIYRNTIQIQLYLILGVEIEIVWDRKAKE